MYLFPSCFPLTYQTIGSVFIHATVLFFCWRLVLNYRFNGFFFLCIGSLTCAPVAYHNAFSVMLGSSSFRSPPTKARRTLPTRRRPFYRRATPAFVDRERMLPSTLFNAGRHVLSPPSTVTAISHY
jgi:hypothetical protein